MSATLRIARTEVTDAVRSYTPWVATALLGLFILARLWIHLDRLEQMTYPFLTMFDTFKEFIPLVAIVLGYKSVVGERNSGRIRVLLGQPGTRWNVVIGKFIGRSVTIFAVISVVGLLLLGYIVVQFETAGPAEIVGGGSALVLYTFAWIGATVGVSSFASTETRAVGIMLGLYALFAALWNNLVIPLVSLLITGNTATGVDPLASRFATLEEPTWYLYVNRLNPLDAFEGARYYIPHLFDMLLAGGTTSAPHVPNLFGLFVLVAWATVPVVAGYWQFERADLD